jgi:hypothetical protein
LDQNPAYYELLQEAAFKTGSEQNITEWLVKRAHRRYFGRTGSSGDDGAFDAHVAAAWGELARSGYANNAPVHDGYGVGLMPAHGAPDWMGFESDARTPKPALCAEWRAWGDLLAAAPRVATPRPLTYVYDLVDLGREVLAQLTIPVSQNFSAVLHTSAGKVGTNLELTYLLYLLLYSCLLTFLTSLHFRSLLPYLLRRRSTSRG